MDGSSAVRAACIGYILQSYNIWKPKASTVLIFYWIVSVGADISRPPCTGIERFVYTAHVRYLSGGWYPPLRVGCSHSTFRPVNSKWFVFDGKSGRNRPFKAIPPIFIPFSGSAPGSSWCSLLPAAWRRGHRQRLPGRFPDTRLPSSGRFRRQPPASVRRASTSRW